MICHLPCVLVVRKRLAKKPKKHQSAKPAGTGKIHNAVKRKARLCCIPCGKDIDLSTVGHCRAVQICKKCWRPMSFVCISRGSKCSSLFNTYIHLKINCKALPAKFHCPKCSYKSKRKRHIKVHIQFRHSAQKCRVCDKKISNYTDYTRHRGSDCPQKFDISSIVGIFSCNDCDYFTKSKSNLAMHIKSIHYFGDEPSSD